MEIYRDKTAVVTGGASGLGKALCKELGKYGADVVVADINLEGARSVAEEMRLSSARAEAVLLDVTIEEDVRNLVERTAAEKGRLDYIFNNAGIGVSGEFQDIPLEQWRRIVDINLWGVIYGTLAAYRVMIRQGHGHIVNIASAAGLVPFPFLTAYTTTKHAVVGLSAGLRAEAAELGVKVSVACPGLIDTPFEDNVAYVNTSKDLLFSVSPSGLTKMRMSPGDCAAAILRGVAENKGIISGQFLSQVLWWVQRLSPKIMESQTRKTLEKYRKIVREKR
jgi:NAD(P)-dependent dehydrogenase (short-subunit alcohol dehydrogenase family)